MENFKEKINRIRTKLVGFYPFFTYLISYLKYEIVDNSDFPMCINGKNKTIYISKEFLKENDPIIAFAYAHEIFHFALKHFSRGEKLKKYNHDLWNKATDLAINSLLINFFEKRLKPEDLEKIKNSFLFPFQFNFPNNLSSEEYYHKLLNSNIDINMVIANKFIDKHIYYKESNETEIGNKISQNMKEFINQFEDLDSNNEKINEEVENNYIKETFNGIKKNAEKNNIWGNIPAWFKKEVEEKTKPSKINWRDKLQNTIKMEYNKIKYNWHRPHKRLISYWQTNNIFIPKNEPLNKFILNIAIDTSGSIDNEKLSLFMSEAEKILNSVKEYEINVFICDCEIKNIFTLKRGDDYREVLKNLQGGGGTSFVPVFEELDKRNDKNPLFYFTDLVGTFPNKNDPRRKVFWCVMDEDKENVKIPFGEIIVID